MGTIAVIGAGASGMVAAIEASKRHKVILIDGNDRCGKKLLLTGNGRCNYWNSNITVDRYNTDCLGSLERILSVENVSETFKWLTDIGIYPRIKNEHYYPYSNQASSVRELFERKISNSSIKFYTGFKVEQIKIENTRFSICSSEGKNVFCVKIIIATGSKAYEKTGSNGIGYSLATNLGHSVNQPLPALTGLISNGKFLKDWDKIRSDARVTLIVNGKALKSDTGEIQLTSKAVSGICVFNISGLTAKHIHQGDSTELEINFMPNLEKGFYEWFDTRCSNFEDMTLETALESIFNYKLMFVLLEKAIVNRNMFWANMNDSQRQSLCDVIEHFRIPVIDTEKYERAQVCTGGVPVSEINPHNMESLILPGVHFVGEVLDVDGQCGGYNLAFAFVSGYVAGKNI